MESAVLDNYRLAEDGQSEADAVVWQNDCRKADIATMATSSDIFISYSRSDRDRIRPLVEAPQDDGWSVWWDGNILPGQPWSGAIESALREAKCVIVFWSRSSIESIYAAREIHAYTKSPLVFYSINASSMTPTQLFRACGLEDSRIIREEVRPRRRRGKTSAPP